MDSDETQGAERADRASGVELAADPRVRSERFVVRSYEIDLKARLYVATILNYMQETAAIDVLARGSEGTDLLARKQVWMLSRLALEIDARPGWRDEVVVRTWASGVQGRLLALRDFVVDDGTARSQIRCTTAWLYIDVASRRPLRVDRGLIDAFPVRPEHVVAETLNKLPTQAAVGSGAPFSVRYRDVDINQHVNNARYVEYIVASVPPDVLSSAALARLEVDFLAEAKLGDVVRVHCGEGEAPGVFLHSVVRDGDGRECVRARTRWRTP